ncbi:MAG: G5 domain-containing protein [Syntrophothermus sp.]
MSHNPLLSKGQVMEWFRGIAAWLLRYGRPLRERRVQVLLAAGLLVAVALVGYTWLRKEVTIAVDSKKIKVVTFRSRVSGVLSQARIAVGSADRVVPGLQEPLKEGMHISVFRAVPVTILVDGAKISRLTTGQTVREVLQETGIKLGVLDMVAPALASPVQAGASLRVTRVKIQTVTKNDTILFDTIRRADDQMERGVEKIIQAGGKGLQARTFRLRYEDGRLVKKELLKTEVLKRPVPKVVVYGTKTVIRTLLTSRGAYRYKEVRVMEATAYDPGPKSNYPFTGITALGTRARYGVVAVDPRVIPLRSRLYIPGYGEARAEDTGSAIKGNRIDLCFETRQEAIQFGRRWVKVYILADGE